MRSGHQSPAAGVCPTGTSPILASITAPVSASPCLPQTRQPAPSPFRALRKISAPCNLEKLDFAQKLSNRHKMQLEFTATSTKQTTGHASNRPKLHLFAPRTSATPIAPSTISNRHLVRLEITASRPESTTSLFLIDPNQHICFRKIACRAGCPPPISRSLTPTSRPVVRATRREYTRQNMNLIVATQQFQIGKCPA
jgi:hypothetical protein